MNPAELQKLLNERIPLTRALGVEVLSADAGAVRLRAPLEPNINHHATAFAGSLASISILAGWSWVVLALQRHGHDASVVVRNAAIDYLLPVDCAIDALCLAPSDEKWLAFESSMTTRAKGKLQLEIQVVKPDGALAARATGTFAAKSRRERE